MIDHLASGGVEPRGCPTPGACSCVAADARHVPMLITDAVRDVLAERRRQVEVEGYTLTHDDEHTCGELGLAAALYALPYAASAGGKKLLSQDDFIGLKMALEIGCEFTTAKPEPDARRRLVKAGALILAEIERIDRAKAHAND